MTASGAAGTHDVETVYGEAVARHRTGRLGEALAGYDRVLALVPGHADAHLNRGNVLKDLGRMEDALAAYDTAIALAPGHADAHNNRGAVLKDLRRPLDALAAYDAAIVLAPGHAAAHNNRGNVLRDLGRMEDALAAYDTAIALAPGHAAAYVNRAHLLRDLGRIEEALAGWERALALQPELAYGPGRRLRLKLNLCDWTDFDREAARVEALALSGAAAAAPFDLLAFSDSPAAQRRAAERFLAGRPASARIPAAAKTADDARLRLGYFSADFHAHATMHLMAEVFERHDRRRIAATAFSFGPDRDDDWRRRAVGAFDAFVDIRALSDGEAAALARARGIDIAIDLKGFTEDSRPGIFAGGAAPLQASYLGYPGTLGAPWCDYLIADRTVIPAAARAFYAEKIVYLPDSYQANRGLAAAGRGATGALSGEGRRAAGLPEGAIVYACFNSCHKITPPVFDAWMRILRQVPGAVLWLWADLPAARDNLRRAAERRGVDGPRLVFAGALPLAGHLDRLPLADLFLDTLPYNAHTTGSDALRMGLPVLTCAGRSFAARVGASLLGAVGLPELITARLEDYETLAVDLAVRPGALDRIRRKLAAQLPACPLFDAERFTRSLERGLLEMSRRSLSGLPPEDIHVDPP